MSGRWRRPAALVLGVSWMLAGAAAQDRAPPGVQPENASPSDTAGGSGAAALSRAEVNSLIVEARKAYDRAVALAGADRAAALNEALVRLKRIVDEHPGSDHAVTLIGGGEVAGISIPLIEAALAGDAPEAATRPAEAPAADARATPGPAVRRLTVSVTLLREAMETDEGRFRLGVHYLPDMRSFATTFDLASGEGALVLGVTENSPAAAAGILPGDVIVRMAGRTVEQSTGLNTIIEETPSSIAVEAEIARIGSGPDDLTAALRDAAGSDDVEALLALAELTSQGFDGSEPDAVEVVRVYRRAANLGSSAAALRLGGIYRDGRGVAIDKAEATHWYEAAALAGEAGAKVNLGLMYWNGEYWNGSETISDDTEAVRLFRAAAEAEITDSYFYLGVAHHLGRGAAKDEAEARRWYEKAIDAGSTAAMNNLGQMYLSDEDGNLPEAVRLFERAAAGGNAGAQRQLGVLYRDGRGVTADKPRVAGYFREAAVSGDHAAMYSLAVMLFNGDGIPTDEGEAVEWFGKASAAGDGDADYALAIAHANGRGVAVDADLAADRLFAAIERGNAAAAEQMKTNPAGWDRHVRTGLQQRLKARGLYAGTIDGQIGPGTLRAIDRLAASGDDS